MTEPAAKKQRLEEPSPELMRLVEQRNKRDWPKVAPGAAGVLRGEEVFDLVQPHDGPHASAKIEWWYANGHVDSADGKLSFFAAFFRLAVDEAQDGYVRAAAGDPPRATCVNWAVVDHATQRHRTFGYVEPAAPAIFERLMDQGTINPDRHIGRAMRDLFRRGEVPGPDQMMAAPGRVGADGLDLDFAGCTLKALPRGDAAGEGRYRYALHLEGTDAHGRAGLDAEIVPTKAPVLHGTDGVVSMGDDFVADDMFYYFFPRCAVTGSAALAPQAAAVPFTGVGWLDHEFGGTVPATATEFESIVLRSVKARKGLEYSWEWAAVQLDNDVEVSLTLLIDPATRAVCQKFVVLREGTAPSRRLDGASVDFAPDEASLWASTETGIKYPTAFDATIRLDGGATVCTLRLEAVVRAQEFITLAAKPAYWEGHVNVSGQWRGASVKGDGFVECSGMQTEGGVEAYYTLMETALCLPLEEQTKALAKALPAEAMTPAVFAGLCAPMVEMVTSMAQATAGLAVNQAQKDFTTAICAAHCMAKHGGAAAREAARAHLTQRWEELRPSIPNNFQRLLLHSWALRQLEDPPQEEEASAPSNGAAADGARSFVVPPEATLTAVPTAAVMERAHAAFPGRWVLNKKASEKLGPVLAVQGVNLVIRQLTDRLVPTLTTTVTATEVRAVVKTAMSNQEIINVVNGEPTKWFSSGRGDLVSQACLVDGGSTLYMRTPVEGKGVEHKWFARHDDGGVPGCVEYYRFVAADGTETCATRHFVEAPAE